MQKNITYFSLCTDYFVLVTCTENKVNRINGEYIFLFVFTAFCILFPHSPEELHFINPDREDFHFDETV